MIHFRVPKKNHDAMILFCKQFNDIFKKYGILHWEIFQLSRTDNMEGFTNISKTVFANPNEEEVWVELLSYRDSKHKDEIMSKMKDDKNCEQGYRQFLDLITPGSKVIYGDFSRLNDLGFV
jgi:uncharacterized protein YbaA (DUF1428 family)